MHEKTKAKEANSEKKESKEVPAEHGEGMLATCLVKVCWQHVSSIQANQKRMPVFTERNTTTGKINLRWEKNK